jgi:hypothetical protein
LGSQPQSETDTPHQSNRYKMVDGGLGWAQVQKNAKRYASFLHTHYSKHTLLYMLLVFSVLAAIIIEKIARLNSARTLSTTVWVITCVPQFLLVVALALLTYVWSYKPAKYDAASESDDKTIIVCQSSTPVFVSVALSMFVFTEMAFGTEDIEQTLLAQSVLKTFPLLSFYVMRDTRFGSIWIGWIVCLTTLTSVAVYSQSLDHLSSVVSYACMSGVIMYDSRRQSALLFSVVARLQDALVDNEKLAVEAQSLELRAMIGNVAHDLKTVRVLAQCVSGLLAC